MLAEMDSTTLTGWLAYLRLDDEQQMIRMARVFMGTGKQTYVDDDEEEVIDTTQPEFAREFKGFINKKSTATSGFPGIQNNTEIRMG